MFRPRSVGNVIALLFVLGLGIGPSSDRSAAQMMMDRPPAADAIQQAVQSARDRNQKSSAAKSGESKAAKPATDKPVQSAKRESTEQKKKSAGPAQPANRNPSGVPPANERRYQPDEVVVEVAAASGDAQINTLVQRFRLARLETLNFQLGGTTLLRLRIPDRRSVPAVVRALETDASVLSAQPNYLFALVETNSDTAASAEQYELDKMRLTEAHQLARGGKVVVAVIDSGVDISHPDLAGDIADTLDAIGTGVPVHKHGTAIAGGIAAHGRLTGVAPAAQILAIRAFSGSARPEDSTGTTFAIMKGMDWAVLHGARVINMSFAGPQDPGITRGIAAAFAKGVVLVAAAGNKGATSPPLFPAADRNVIAVTSTDRDNQLPEFANRGPHVAVAAPGVDLTLLAPNDSLQKSSGTSFSAAYVSGTVALMIERNPSLSPDAVRKALMASAQRLGSKPVDEQSGGGLVDVYQAILTVAPAAASEKTVTPAVNRQ
jgi:subtilisin family serine protease